MSLKLCTPTQMSISGVFAAKAVHFGRTLARARTLLSFPHRMTSPALKSNVKASAKKVGLRAALVADAALGAAKSHSGVHTPTITRWSLNPLSRFRGAVWI